EHGSRLGRPTPRAQTDRQGRWPSDGARRSTSEGCQGRPVLPDGEDATLPRLRHDRLGGPMQRGRTLFWTITGSVVAAVAVVITLILVNSGTPPKTASSPAPSVSASASPQASKPAPGVTPV